MGFQASAQDETRAEVGRGANFGGPNAVPNQIQSDAEQSLLGKGITLGEDWDNWKAELLKDHGVSLGIDYSAVYLNASDTLSGADDTAAGGMLRFYGNWDATGRGTRNTGSFVWKVEHRHAYGSTVPSGFGLNQLGYVGLLAPPFNDQGLRWTNLYWRQRFGEGRATLVAGMLDVTDFLDIYGLVSPWLHFNNLVFSTGSASIALPNEAALGAGIGTMLSENIYLIASLVDANSDPEDPFDGFETFFDDREYFTSIEIGWTTGQGLIYLDNYHVTLWHKDKQDKISNPDGWGINVSFARYVDERWMPFVRAGYADDGGTLLEKTLSGGIGYWTRPGKGLLGAGLNWGEPNEDTFGPGRDDQYTAELFYRFLLGKRFNLTADLQYLKDPALNPTENSVWVFGLRGRLAF